MAPGSRRRSRRVRWSVPWRCARNPGQRRSSGSSIPMRRAGRGPGLPRRPRRPPDEPPFPPVPCAVAACPDRRGSLSRPPPAVIYREPLEVPVVFGLLGGAVGAAYHVVSAVALMLAPLPGGLAAAAAIVLFTVAVRLVLLPLSYYAIRGQASQARLAPQVTALRQRHARQPDRLQRELTELYRRE